MALCRQGSESLQDWNNSSGATFRAHDHYSTRHGECGSCSNRTPMKCYRGKKFGRVAKSRQCSIGVLVVIFFGLVGLTLLGSNYRVGDKGETVLSEDTEFFDNQQGHSTHYSFQNSKAQDYSSAANQNNRKEGNNEILERSRRHGHALVYGSGSRTSKVLGFGQGSTGSGQDSRYWDRDDRRRDEEYDEENFQISNTDFKSGFRQNNIGWHKRKKSITESDFTSHVRDGVKEDKQGKNNKGARHSVDHEGDNMSTRNPNGQEFENGGLYNERGRNELKIYEAQYLADLKEELGLSGTGRGDNVDGSDGAGYIKGGDVIKHPSIERGYDKSLQVRDHEQIDADDEYDDGIDEEDIHAAEVDSVINRQGIQGVPGMPKEHTQGYDRKDLLETQGNLPKENPGYVKEKQMLEIGNYFDGGSSLHKYHGQGYDRKDLLETQSHLSKDTQVYDRKDLLETQGNLPKENPGYAKEKQMLEIGNDFDRGSSLHKYHGQGYDRKDLLETQSHLSEEQLGAGKWKEKPENAIKSDFDNELSLFIHGFQEDSAKETSKLENASLKVDTGKRNTYLSKSKHRKRASAPCEIGFLNSTVGLLEPEENSNFAKFSLQYIESEEKPEGLSVWKPRFAGHQTLVERENSFYAQDQKLHCGFIKGPEGSSSTGFDLAEEDSKFLNTCHIAVSSCIFGNSDNIRTPTGKKVTQFSKKNVCFVMFVDEKTLHTMSSEGREPNEDGYIGLWKVVVVRNLPYTDMRRTGKVPKFLTHRLFPSARYSIWLDSKMRLQSDPLLILEYFLWRGGFEYAISNHYDRHCVWEEVMQNKRLNKFNHTVIDEQFAYYQADGLTKFNASDSNKLLPSHVPEGSFIVRAHTPMSNLFSCLWFNEVDRFTPRDQLSFAYTFLKLTRMNPEKHFFLNMFKDCERRAMAKLFRHRPEETPPSVSSVSKV